jgi:hypothetical protein
MCVDPLTMAVAATAVTAATTVVSGVQQHQQGRYQARVAKRNQQMAAEGARDAIDRGRREQVIHGRRTAALRGQQTVGMAANGIDVAFGSGLTTLGDTAMIGAEDAAILRENTVREARGYQIEAANYGAQAAASRQAASGALFGTALSLGGTILSGASQVRRIKAAQAAGGTGW